MKPITSIEELTLDPRNANRGTERGQELLEDSLSRHGAGRGILTDRRGVVIAGNKTLARARALGLDVIVVPTDGRSLVVTQRQDLDLERDPVARELAIADNQIAAVDLNWDTDILAEFDAEGLLGRLFTEGELEALLSEPASAEGEPGAGGDEFDTTPAPDEQPTRTQLGDVWGLGRHRLLVADATDRTSVERFMAGEVADLVVTDPPYGVAYVGGTADALTMENDDLGDEGTRELVRDLLLAAPLRPGGSFYVCSPAGNTETAFRLGIADAGLELRQCLVWVKQQFVLGRQDYHWRHESILYGWRAGAVHYFVDDRTLDTVWEFDRPQRNIEHPTKKPVDLIAHAIHNSSRPGEIVYDACGGSGTTLVAAERAGRRCRMVEIDPRYADVVLARFTAETGQEPELLDRR